MRDGIEQRGLPGNSLREWAQVQIGDRLLRFILEIFVALAQSGLCGFVEHPQYPVWKRGQQEASIWTMDVIRYLRSLECMAVLSFDQCTCGGESVKPTTLLLLRLPDVREQLLKKGHMGRCPHRSGAHKALRGKTEESHYNTAKAKIYPPGLNAALADSMYKFAVNLGTDGRDCELPDVFADMYHEQKFDECTVQPDFHG